MSDKEKDSVRIKPNVGNLQAYLPPTKGVLTRLPIMIRVGIPKKQPEPETAE